MPYVDRQRATLLPEAILVDRSNAMALDVDALPAASRSAGAERRWSRSSTASARSSVRPSSSPSYPDAVRYLRWPGDATVFLVVRLHPGTPLPGLKRAIQSRLPEVDVWTRDEFSRRARLFWVQKTGAGGAILLVAILGFLVGMVIVSQNIYATTMENLEEFATLKAIGARRWYVQKVVLTQALACGIVGSTRRAPRAVAPPGSDPADHFLGVHAVVAAGRHDRRRSGDVRPGVGGFDPQGAGGGARAGVPCLRPPSRPAT